MRAASAILLLFALVASSLSSRAAQAQSSDYCGYDTTRALSLPIEDVVDADDPVMGDPQAEVAVVEFFDPNCVHCRALHPIMDEVVDRYDDRIRYIRKPFALSRHSLDQVAAILIAGEEGKSFAMADLQMESPDAPYLSHDQLAQMAADLEMDVDAFREALVSGEYLNPVERLRRQARAAGVKGTPTVVIGRSDQVVAATVRSAECIGRLIEAEIGG